MAHARLELSAELSAVPTARHWTNEHCTRHLKDEARQIVELLTTELVTNAVVHGYPPLLLELECDPHQVQVAVSDDNPALPRRRCVGPEATGGRGIALVDLLATDWGHRPTPSGRGKTTWFRYVVNA